MGVHHFDKLLWLIEIVKWKIDEWFKVNIHTDEMQNVTIQSVWDGHS